MADRAEEIDRARPLGVCPECGIEFAIRQDGMLRTHRGGPTGPWYCSGSGQPPVNRVDHVHRCEVCAARWDEETSNG